jgi:DNA-binding NarL/FixJ family response regulator
VVVLTTFELDEYVFESLRAGASGFLVKDTEPAELLRAVRVVAAGESLLSPSVTRRVVGEFAARSPRTAPHPELSALTDREREIVGLMARGLSNDEIADHLVVSPATASPAKHTETRTPPVTSPACLRLRAARPRRVASGR